MATSAKPPRSRCWTTTSRRRDRACRSTGSRIQAYLAVAWPRGGITTSDPTYQIFDRARALSTKVLPLKDSALCLQDLRQFRTASIRGSQFASSMPAFPIKFPSTLILENVQLMATGTSTRSCQEPSYRPSHLLRFNLDPVPFSKQPYTSKTKRIARSR